MRYYIIHIKLGWELRPSKKQVAHGCGGLLGCGVASAASQNRSQVMLWKSKGMKFSKCYICCCYVVFISLSFQTPNFSLCLRELKKKSLRVLKKHKPNAIILALKWTDSLGNRLIVWMERRPSLEQFLIC